MNYQVSLDYDDYFANSQNITAKNIEVVGDSILFETNKEGLDYLDENNICYMLHKDKKAKRKHLLISKSGILIAILICAFLIYFNSFRVSKIAFNGTYPINEEIEAYVMAQNQQILGLTFHKNNYDSLSKNLRAYFKEYEWITVSKKGSVIYVDIEPTTTKKMTEEISEAGNIVAKKSGIVESYCAFNGQVLVENNSYVSEGDVLIQGSTSARGYVLAITYEEITLTIEKEVTENKLSGNYESYLEFEVFGQAFSPLKKQSFADFISKKNTQFTLPYLLKVNRIENYEKNDIIYVYTKDEAIAYGKTLIEASFTSEKVLNEEAILRLEMLVAEETDSTFVITYLVKKRESIGVFKKNS